MKLRKLGNSGLQVSLIGLGCNNFNWQIDLEQSRKVMHKAMDLGITLFDTADVYGLMGGSETAMGQIMGDRRKDIILATKCGLPMDKEGLLQGASRRYIMSAVEASLRRLKTDWIDLYQIHVYDPNTPIEETLRALDDLVRSGKVRYIGCSSFPSWRELLPAAQAYNMGLLPYFPLASGALTGKYKRNAPMPEGARLTSVQRLADKYLGDAQWAKIEGLEKFCAERGRSMVELSFSWLAARPQVSSIIAGATKPEQLEMNVKSAGWALSAEDLAAIDKITAPA